MHVLTQLVRNLDAHMSVTTSSHSNHCDGEAIAETIGGNLESKGSLNGSASPAYTDNTSLLSTARRGATAAPEMKAEKEKAQAQAR